MYFLPSGKPNHQTKILKLVDVSASAVELNRIWMQLCKLCFRLVWTLIFCVAIHNFLQKSNFLQIFARLCDDESEI